MSSGRCGSNGSMASFNRFIADSAGGHRRRSPWRFGFDLPQQNAGLGRSEGIGAGTGNEDEDPL